MSVNLQGAFNMVISLKGKTMTLEDLENNIQISIKVAQSNYFRNFAAPGEMEIPGREFIISNSEIKDSTITDLKEGMRLIDATSKEYIIVEIVEMPGLHGEILGYRLRTE